MEIVVNIGKLIRFFVMHCVVCVCVVVLFIILSLNFNTQVRISICLAIYINHNNRLTPLVVFGMLKNIFFFLLSFL